MIKPCSMTTCSNDDVFEWARQWSWHRNSTGYASRWVYHDGHKGEIKLHRALADRWGWNIAGLEIDHVNQDRLDNQRRNLRVATHGQNQQNTPRFRNSTTGVKGVSRKVNRVGCLYYVARIQVDKRRITLGYFRTLDEAAAAYAEGSARYHGAFGLVDDGGRSAGVRVRARRPRYSLTAEQVVELRSRDRSGVPRGVLARQYGITRTYCWRLCNGRARTEVP